MGSDMQIHRVEMTTYDTVGDVGDCWCGTSHVHAKV